VVAEERFRIPLTVSIPKVLTYPLIQLSRIKKLELMVILEADIESDPKIVVVVTVAIFLIYLFSTSIFYLSYISMVETRLKIIISEN
jgi:ABC-type siderophore export system fused ATPase/permease subunit